MEPHAHPAIDRVIAGRLAWTRLGDLFAAGFTRDDLRDLVRAGYLAFWREKRAVTLTPLAAELRRVEIGEFGPKLKPRWVELGTAPAERLQRPAWMESLPVWPLGEGEPQAPPVLELLEPEPAKTTARLGKLMGVWVQLDRRIKPAKAGRRKAS